MKLADFFTTLLCAALAGAVLWLSHYDYVWVAVALACVPAVIYWARRGRSKQAILTMAPDITLGVSAALLIGVTRSPLNQAVFPAATQAGIAIAYGLLLMVCRYQRIREQASPILLATVQSVAVGTLLLLAAFWHWPQAVVVALVWVVIVTTTLWYLSATKERLGVVLAATWGLVASQLIWILLTWQVNYVILGGAIIIPQAALVILGVGYCFGSIYHAHKQRTLSRRRLIEYVAVAGLLLTIVISGTRWGVA